MVVIGSAIFIEELNIEYLKAWCTPGFFTKPLQGVPSQALAVLFRYCGPSLYHVQ